MMSGTDFVFVVSDGVRLKLRRPLWGARGHPLRRFSRYGTSCTSVVGGGRSALSVHYSLYVLYSCRALRMRSRVTSLALRRSDEMRI